MPSLDENVANQKAGSWMGIDTRRQKEQHLPDSLLLRLTQAEVSLLLHILDLSTLPGLAADLLEGLDEAQRRVALSVAEQTLRARCLIGWTGDKRRVLHPGLASLFRDYACPLSTLFVDTALPAGRGIPFLYVFGQQGIYEQCQPEPDIVQFRALTDRDEMVQRLSPRLPERLLADPERWCGRIQQCVLNSALRIVRHDRQGACRLFASTLPLQLAEALAEAYHAPRVVQYVACWQTVPGAEQRVLQAALTIIQGPKQTFLLWVEQPEQGETSLVQVRPYFSNILRHYIERLVPSLLPLTE